MPPEQETVKRSEDREMGAVQAAILIVDDHPANLLALEATLTPLGHRVVRAKSGEEALKRLLQENFALILLDVMMPGLDGFQTAAIARQREMSRATPIIFLSALSKGPGDFLKGYAHGAVDYMVKPFDPEILRAKVEVFVELYLGREQNRRQAAALRERDRERTELQRVATEDRHARKQAEAGEALYQVIAESIPQQLWTSAPDGALDYVSPLVASYFKQPAAKILGAGWQDVIHPDDLAECVKRWTFSLTTGEEYEVEFRLRRHDGVYHWHLGRAVALRNAAGAIIRWFGTNTDIDDRKRAEAALLHREAALRDSEERLRIALDAGQMGAWEWSIGSGEIHWSEPLERMHGLAPGSFAGTFEACQSDIHPQDRELVLRTISESVSAKKPHGLSYRIIRPDGQVRWLEARGKLVFDGGGQPVRLVGVCSDITERREAEDRAQRLVQEKTARLAAEAAEEGLRQVMESISDPLFILDANWVITYLNAGAATILGKSHQALLGSNLWKLFPESVGGRFYVEYHRARDERAPVSIEHYYPALESWFEVKAYPTSDGRLTVHYRSITARKRAEELLKRQVRHAALRADVGLALSHQLEFADVLQACCQALVGHLGAAFARIWTLNHETRMLELQASAGLYTHLDGGHARVPVGKFKIGLVAEELKPYLTNDVIHDPRVGDRDWAAKNQLVAFAGYPLVVDGRCVGVVALFSREAIAGDTLEAIGSAADAIAQGVVRKRVEEALQVRAKELSRSNAELERFAYVASHDLQEPLRMVASYTQLLGRRYKGKLDAAADEFIEFAIDGANRMQALINDLLSFSRVGTTGKALVSTSLEQPLVAALANLRASIAESGAVVTHDPLPTALIDHQQLVQLFQNLIGNGIKFHGSEPPRVHVSAQTAGKEICVSVRDNGIGISPDYFERLFILFQRLHNRTEYPGTGIGLAICKKIAERHGGRIWVESAPDKGSTFFFTLKGGET